MSRPLNREDIQGMGALAYKDSGLYITKKGSVYLEVEKDTFISMLPSYDHNHHKVYRDKLLCGMVAELFMPNPNKWEYVRYISEDTNDNSVDNLMWCNGDVDSDIMVTGMHFMPNRALGGSIA